MGAAQYQTILDGQYVGGMDSLLYPTDLAPGTYAYGINVTNRGGIIQTRPGKRRIISFCGRKAQGHFWARTIDDRNYELVAIDGKVYWAPFPFTKGTWTQLAGVSFSPYADWIYFVNTIQAIQYDGTGAIVVVEPRNVVFMQDGINTPCYWRLDDFSSGFVNATNFPGNPDAPSPNQNRFLPIGTAMLWQDNRLWVAADDLVFASDLLYGASFHEDTYLAEQSGFRFPRKVVNMYPAPVQGIQVYTESSMHSLASFVQDRTQWQTTEGFQSDVNLEIGIVGPWAYGLLHGMPWLMTHRGIISYDRALTQNLSTVILTMDGEMQRSKNLFASDISKSCIGTWENILLVSVPASCTENRHTWILDAGISQKLSNSTGMCWSGIWTGTYPIQYTSPIVNGTQHCYVLAYSAGYLALNEGDSPSPQPETDLALQSYIHLWENFIPNQMDDVETEVNCSFETKAFTLQTDDYYRFVFAEFMLVNLRGIVPVQVYVTGLAGNYQLLFSTTLRADVGPWGNPTINTDLYYVSKGRTTEFENYRRQVRHMRTKEWVVNEQPTDGAACLEIGRMDGIDKGFQLMLQWQGRLGVRMIKFFYDRQLQSPQGNCPTDESATPHIVLEATA
jgi:hypothetical protein